MPHSCSGGKPGLIAELVIEAAGCLVLARVERKARPRVSFKLGLFQERIPRDLPRIQTRSRRYSQSAGQRGGTSRGRYAGPR